MPHTIKQFVIDLVVPAHNVAGELAQLLANVPMSELRSVVVVDNGSADSTAQVALDAGAVVVREARVGVGAAYRRALGHLGRLPQPPDVVILMAGDGSDDPADIPALLEPLKTDNAELVIGVRARPPRRTRIALGLISAIYRHHFDDIGSIMAIRYPALVALGMADRGAGWNVEMLVKAVKLGLHIVEVPVAYHRPLSGADGAVTKMNSTGRVLFQILRNSTAR